MILISAGHYPEKPGACFEGFCEFDEASRWADEILKHLPPESALRVPATPLKKKVAFINSRNPDLALEIHFNSAKIWEDLNNNGVVDEGEMKNVGRGALTLYYPGSNRGKVYAAQLQSSMEPTFGTHWNGVMEGWYRMNPKLGPDFFLAKTKCQAVIIEPEFIHHKDKLISNREVVCYNIAEVLRGFL